MHATKTPTSIMSAPPPRPAYCDSFTSDKDDKASSTDEYGHTRVGVVPVEQRAESAMGDAILRFLRIRKGGVKFDPDAIATQPSLWDSEDVEDLKARYIHPEWENLSAFDPTFRWTYREESKVRRKIDIKIMVGCSAARLTPDLVLCHVLGPQPCAR
jgi:hypothetical protein